MLYHSQMRLRSALLTGGGQVKLARNAGEFLFQKCRLVSFVVQHRLHQFYLFLHEVAAQHLLLKVLSFLEIGLLSRTLPKYHLLANVRQLSVPSPVQETSLGALDLTKRWQIIPTESRLAEEPCILLAVKSVKLVNDAVGVISNHFVFQILTQS